MSVSDAIQRASSDSGGIGEIVLSHVHTQAELHVRLPDNRYHNGARALLYHSLHPSIPDEDSGFIRSLKSAHRRIAGIYESEYLHPHEDPRLILEGRIPHDYNERKLYTMMTAITACALRIQRLHDDVSGPLNDVMYGDNARKLSDRSTRSSTVVLGV